MQKSLMTLMFLIGALTFQSTAFANSECIPSMSVEAAQAQYEAGVSNLAAELQQSYADAEHSYNQANATSLTEHKARTLEIANRYQQDIQAIRADYKPGWQEAMNAAAQRYNTGLRESSRMYVDETQAHLAAYEEATEEAQAQYSAGAIALALQYNTAVCAGQ